jgi:hypothetical protein
MATLTPASVSKTSAAAKTPKSKAATKTPITEPSVTTNDNIIIEPITEPTPSTPITKPTSGLNLDELNMAAAAEPEDDDPFAEPTERQHIIKLISFVDELKVTHPTATRFDIYFFSDRIQTYDDYWGDAPPTHYLKPVIIKVLLSRSEFKLILCDSLDEKYKTADWGIYFSENTRRVVIKDSIVNILKISPESKEYAGNTYYDSRMFKPNPSESALADKIIEQCHDTFPVFKKQPAAPKPDSGKSDSSKSTKDAKHKKQSKDAEQYELMMAEFLNKKAA